LEKYNSSFKTAKNGPAARGGHLHGRISAHLKKLDERLVTEEMGLEKDIGAMIKRISFIENKNEKLTYIMAARRVIAVLIEKRFTRQPAHR